MLVVSATALRELVPMKDAIEAVEMAFVSVVNGSTPQPPRLVSGDGSALAMLAQGPDGGVDAGTVFKVVSVWDRNRERNLPTVHALAIWFDEETRRPELLVEGGALTSLRTGAATGVATRLLAAPDASTLAMVGAGGQAADQIRAVCAVRPIDEVRICSLSGASARSLADRLAVELPGVEFTSAGSVTEAVAGAEVVCTATSSAQPVVPADAIEGRVHVNAIGSYRRDMCELPPELVAGAELLAVDSREAALAEAGEIIAAIERGDVSESSLTELGRLALAPPAEAEAVTIFKSVGLAVQDWAICRLLSDRRPADAPVVSLS